MIKFSLIVNLKIIIFINKIIRFFSIDVYKKTTLFEFILNRYYLNIIIVNKQISIF